MSDFGPVWDEPTYQFIVRRARQLIAAGEALRADGLLELGQHMLERNEQRWIDESLASEQNRLARAFNASEIQHKMAPPPPELAELELTLAWVVRLQVIEKQIAALDVMSRSGPYADFYRATLAKAKATRDALYKQLAPPAPTEVA